MSGGTSVYSPLPQSNSDTDESSEEELHSLHESRIINKIPNAPDPKAEIILNGQKQKVINYKPLDNERDVNIMLNGFQTNDEVSILTPSSHSEKLSTPRRICFIFSLLLCVLTIVFFIWVLPCDIGSCPSAVTSSHFSSWETPLLQVELSGPISMVPSTFGKSQNLVFLFKNGSLFEDSINDPNATEYLPKEGGVVSLFGHSGEVAWWVKLKRLPKDIDCSLLDVDSDGYKDCLVVGDNNLLKAIQPLSGTELWDVHTDDVKKNVFMYKLDFPLVVPDLDNDGVPDLLTSCSLSQNHYQNHLIVISGKTGAVIGDPIQFSDCIDLHVCSLEQDFNITYTCINARKESFRTTSLLKICASMNFPSDLLIKLHRGGGRNNISQHAKENNWMVEGRHLLLENKGTCPGECNVTVSVKDEREGKKNQTIYFFHSKNGYGMKPVVIGSGEIKGFIVKLWHWHADKEKRSPKTFSSDKDLDREMMSEFYPASKSISERVFLITFNKTDSRCVNTSNFEIIQMCKSSHDCLPDLTSQNKSLLLTDLDQDGSHELISFSTTYLNYKDRILPSKETWKLVSKVRLIRLESELPKLYEPLV